MIVHVRFGYEIIIVSRNRTTVHIQHAFFDFKYTILKIDKKQTKYSVKIQNYKKKKIKNKKLLKAVYFNLT